MQNFNNQYNFRVDNQIKILNILRNGQQSINSLAEKINVSFTAASKIVDQLISFDVLKRVNKKTQSKKRGRVPVLVKINTSVGLTCAIDLSSHDLVITLNDLTGKIVAKRTIASTVFIKEESLKQISDCIKDMLVSDEAENRPLLGICIASPGMVNKETGEIAEGFRVKTYNQISLNNYFFNEFAVPVNIYNDVKISCVGEKVYGAIPSDAKNYVFLHLGSSVGAALVFNGKIYQGKSGYSGEFSNFNEIDDESKCKRNRIYGFSELTRYISKLDSEHKYEYEKFIPNIDALVKQYKANNPSVLEGLEYIAKNNALQFIAYSDFLDLEYIVIEGPILHFKEKYKEYLLKYLKVYDKSEFRPRLLFSELNENSSLIGTIYQANNIYFLNKLEEITNKRSANGKYDISEAFEDNI